MMELRNRNRNVSKKKTSKKTYSNIKSSLKSKYFPNRNMGSKQDRLVNINDRFKCDFFALKFEDQLIEEEFQSYYFNRMRINYLLVHLFFIIDIILKISLTYYNLYVSIIIVNSILLCFLGCGACIFQLCPYLKVKEITNKTLAYCIILIQTINSVVSIVYELDTVETNLIHQNSFYFLLIMAFAIFLFPIEENFTFCLIFVLCNFLIYYAVFFTYVEFLKFNIYQLCIFTVIVMLTLYIKRKNSILFRLNYLHAYKLSKYNFYFEEIINNMNGYLISTNDNKVEFTNKSFKDFFLKYNKRKKFLKPIAERNVLARYLTKNPDLINKKFDAKDYIDINILEKTGIQCKEKNLFLKFFSKEIKLLITKNRNILEKRIIENDVLNLNTNKEKNKENILENINSNEVKFESKIKNEKIDIEYDKKQLDYQKVKELKADINQTIKNENFFSMNTETENDCQLKILTNNKNINDPNKEFQAKTSNLEKGNIKIKNSSKSAIEYLFNSEMLIKKFEEFKINFNYMQKVYLENLFPVELNITKNLDNENVLLKANNLNRLEKENQTDFIEQKLLSQNVKTLEDFNHSDISEKIEDDSNKKIKMNLNVNLQKRNLLQISEIIKSHFHGKNKFYYLGEFKNIHDEKYYQIYFRKNCIRNKNINMNYEHDNISFSESYSDPEFKINPMTDYLYKSKSKKNFQEDGNLENKGTVDFLIYDISKIHKAEKLESKLKSKFLGKIAHEFKTPINSILGLIKRILFNLENEESDIAELPRDIKQVENLCSYTLFLIDDIIEYSFKSNYTNSLVYSDVEDNEEKNRENLHDSKAKSEAGYLRRRYKNFINEDKRKLFKSIENMKVIKNFNDSKTNKKSFFKDKNKKDKKSPKKFIINSAEDESECSYIVDDHSIKKNNLDDVLYSKSENLAKEKASMILNKKANFPEISSSESEKVRKSKEKSKEKDNAQNNKNNLVINKKEVNLAEITAFCKGVAETLLISKGKEFNIKILSDFDEEINEYKISSDEFRIKQILLNFLSNSVKFTKSGYILIKSFIIENNSKIKISIIDSGMGIKEAELKYLFTDKFMSESTKVLNQAGSGLGLSISKSISDKLGFVIEVKSEFGKGSEFSLIINCKGKKTKRKSRYDDNRFENKDMNDFDNNIINPDNITFNNSNNKITIRSKFKKDEIEYDEENIGNMSFSRFNKEKNIKDQMSIHNKSNYEEDLFEDVNLNQEKSENNSANSNKIHFVDKKAKKDNHKVVYSLNDCNKKLFLNENSMINSKENNNNNQKTICLNDEIEENNLQIVCDRNSSSGIIQSERNFDSLNSFSNNPEKIIDEENMPQINLNSLESSIINIGKDFGEKEKSINSLFGKKNENKKFDKSLENGNNSSQSNTVTVELNNTNNNNPYCYKIDNYYKIIEEMKKNNQNHLSLMTESDVSNFKIKNYSDSDKCKSCLIIVQTPEDEAENLEFNLEKFIEKKYASDSNLDFNSNKPIINRRRIDNLSNKNNKNNLNFHLDKDNKNSILSPYDIKHPRLFFQEGQNNLNFSLNSKMDFSQIMHENNYCDYKSNSFNIDFTSEEDNKNEKQKSLFRNITNSNHVVPKQNILNKLESIKNDIANPCIENENSNDHNIFDNIDITNLNKEDFIINNKPYEENTNSRYGVENFKEICIENKNNNFDNIKKITIKRNVSFSSVNNINITTNNINFTANINNNNNVNNIDDKHKINEINDLINDNNNNDLVNINKTQKLCIKTNKILNNNTENLNKVPSSNINDSNKQSIKNNIKNIKTNNENINLNSNNDNAINNYNDKKKQAKKSFFSKEKDKNDELNLDTIPKEKNKILIVDDHTFIRSSLKINLEKILRDHKVKNMEIIEGKDGVDIINYVIKDQEQNNLIKCVFSDENMEYINGSEAFEILKNLESKNKIKQIPLCSVTAYEDTERLYAKNSKYKVIFDKILIKPCSQQELLKFLQEFKIL